MVFKLVRIDSPAPLKIDLTLGKHLIGRGKFLHDDDSDKRVSRNHAELEVTEDSIILKSLHQNPCFYIKRNTTETQLLQQECEVIISNGDKFGLIPDHFWYEVLQIIDQNSDQNGCTENTECPKNEEDEANGAEITDDATEPLNVKIKQEEPDQDIKSSQSLLNQLSAQGTKVEPEVPSRDMNSTMKRSPSTDSPDYVTVKKVKTEPDEAEDARPGPSNDQGTSNANNDNDGHGSPQKPDTTGPASPQKPDGTLRERCMYGANCYRRNPAHKAQFSHPADSDWGAARRPRPRPPRPRPPPPPHAHGPPGMRMVERHGNIYYINAHTVNFYDDHVEVENSDGERDEIDESVDSDYEF